MPVAHDIQEQLSKLDQQIIALLEQRIAICGEALEEDEEALGTEHVAEAVGEWEAAADERGWNLNVMSKLCRVIIELCKSAAQE